MGIDLNKMRQKHAALTNRGGDTNDFFWKPEEGTHQVRLVCPEGGDPFFEAYYHYSMGAEGRTTVLSPRTFGEDDPIAEWGTRLWNEGTDASKEAAKRFWPKMRLAASLDASVPSFQRRVPHSAIGSSSPKVRGLRTVVFPSAPIP